ncbi:MAG TPA: pilus assembly protein PilM [Phycisphaerae bacterium]|nr:pilus assembly protein PilM [Phycisphaerae bacterium]
MMRIGLGSKKLLAIDWDARNLRLVLVRRRIDGVDLLKAVSIPVPPDVKMDDAEALGAFVREAVRQARVGVRQVLMSIPRDQVVLNALDLPPTPPEEMAAIVQFQIVKELPFGIEQATLDFAMGADCNPKEPFSVLVAAVRNEQLAFYRKVAYEAGLSVERIGLRPHANLVAVTAKAPEHKSKTLLLIEVGPQLTEIDVIRNDTLVFSRAASVALPEYGDIAAARLDDSRIASVEVRDREPEETDRRSVNNLMVEIVRSLEAHRATDPSLNVDRIVVCGASGIEPQLSQMLAARFAAQAELYSPERILDLTPQRAKELRGFSAALGLAMEHGQRELESFDFLHPKKHVSKRAVQMKKMPIAVATVLLFVGSAVASYLQYVRPKQQEIDVLNKLMEPNRKAVKDIEEFKAQVEALEDWRDSEQYWPEVLVSLSANFPPDDEVVATQMEFESHPKPQAAAREGRMRVGLRTAVLGKVNEISTKLRDMGYTDVKTGKEMPITGRRGAGKYQTETGVEAILPPRPKPKAKSEEAGRGEALSPASGAGETPSKPARTPPSEQPPPESAEAPAEETAGPTTEMPAQPPEGEPAVPPEVTPSDESMAPQPENVEPEVAEQATTQPAEAPPAEEGSDESPSPEMDQGDQP